MMERVQRISKIEPNEIYHAEQAQALLRNLERWDIEIKSNFIKHLNVLYNNISLNHNSQDARDIIRKINVRYFILAFRNAYTLDEVGKIKSKTNKKTTAPITVLHVCARSVKPALVTGDMDIIEIKKIASLSYFRSVRGILAQRGVKYPLCKIEEVKNFCDAYNIPFSSVSGMYSGKGLPNLDKVKTLYDFCRREGIPFESITGMQNGKGLPDIDDIKTLFELCNRDKRILKSITGMQNGKGLPDFDELRMFIDLFKNANDQIDIVRLRGVTYVSEGIHKYLTSIKV